MINIFYGLLLVGWIGVTILYLYLLWKKKPEEFSPLWRRVKKGSSRKKRGKRCPECRNIISVHREVCQHCGYKFPKPEQEAKTESSAERKPRRGKRCPKCQNKIDYTRTVCQHCGYKFPSFESQNEKPKESSQTES